MEIRRQLQELRDLQKEERKALSKAMVSAVFFFFLDYYLGAKNQGTTNWWVLGDPYEIRGISWYIRL